MSSGSVIEGFNIIKDGSASSEFRLKDLRIWEHLCFDCRKTGFCKCVVIAIAFGTHTLLNPLAKCFSNVVTSILASTVRVKETSLLYRSVFVSFFDSSAHALSS